MKTSKIFLKNLKAFNEKKRIIVNQGGTSAGKTYSILQLLLYILYSSNKKIKITVVSQTYQHLKDGVIYDLSQICEKENIDFHQNYNKSSHEFIYKKNLLQFISLDKPSKALGSRRDILFVNECNYVDFEVFEQLEVRTRGTIFLDFNPHTKFWVHTEILKRENIAFIKSTYLDNILNLEQSIIDSIESKKNKKNWWKIYGLGEIGFSEDLLFQESELKYFELSEIDLSKSDNVVSFIDTADRGKDYLCMVIGAIFGNSIYIIDVIFNQNILGINEDLIIEKLDKYNADYCVVETNKEGSYFIGNLREKQPATNFLPIFNTIKKESRILAKADYILDNFYFLKSQPNEYKKYFENLIEYSQIEQNKNDDAPDATSGLAKFCTNYLKIR